MALKSMKALAERVGFEPTIPVKVYTLSKRAPSATRPSLRHKVGTHSLYKLIFVSTRRFLTGQRMEQASEVDLAIVETQHATSLPPGRSQARRSTVFAAKQKRP